MSGHQPRPPTLASVERELGQVRQAEAESRQELVVAEMSYRNAQVAAASLRAHVDAASSAETRAAFEEAGAAAAHAHRRCQDLEAAKRDALVEHATQARAGATAPAPPPRAVADAPGHDLCPDPLAARSAAELAAALRRYRIWAGEPSYREMARRCKGNIGASTLNTALRSDELPALPVVLAVITACGGSDEDLRRFATAWRELRLAQEDGTQQAAPPRALRPVSAAS
jgi:hypothetical protein